MTREEPNGCGPWWIPQKWKDDYFVQECNVHDEDYLNGDMDRYEADVRFYRLMRQKIMTETSSYKRWCRTQQARFYFYVVRVFGWTSHRSGLDI